MEKELIKFEDTKTSIPFITVKHNNIEFKLLVDTGASISLIDSNVLDLLLHTKTEDKTGGIIYANNDTEDNIPIVEIPINIGGVDFVEKFNAVNLQNMTQQIKENYDITIRGLLGSEFMCRNQFIIDFKEKVIKH